MDLFSGSGALGLEALSRGAESCVFVDSSREAQQVIGKNLMNLKLDGGRVVGGDVFRVLKREHGVFDLVFADPPYFKQGGGTDFVGQLLANESLPGLMVEDGLLVVEDPPANKRGDFPDWELIGQRKYGGCGILFYQRRVAR